MDDFTKGILFTMGGIALLILLASMKKKKATHSLKEVSCPLCTEKFLVVTSGHDYVKCSNCEKILEVQV